MQTPILLAAFEAAGRGWRVFPVHGAMHGRCTCHDPRCGNIAKHPRTPHGVLDATADAEMIAACWKRWPEANVAIATGVGSGLLVLDIDPRHGGDGTLADLEHQHGALPATVTALTGGGGWHLLWQHPGGWVPTRARIAPGIDVRADGGYIVAPPSVHASGRPYAWAIGYGPEDLSIAPAPAWLFRLVTATNTGRLRRDGTPLVIPKGERNHRLAQLGGLLRRYGLGEVAIAAALSATNREHCRPPLDEAEVKMIAASVARYAPVERGGLRIRIEVGV